MTKKILITGGAGYIGSMLVSQLVNLGYEVTVIDLLKFSSNSLNHLHFFKNFKLIVGDVRSKSLIRKELKKNEYIIPLAALVGAPLCEKNKKEAISVNLDSIKLLMKYISKKNKIIYLTSNSGYGVGKKNKFCDEKSPLNPISLYGRTKVEAEKIVMRSKNVICFRLATVFGYSYRMRTDLLVNNFVFNSIKKKELKLFEPHFRRNFIHIKDVVDGILYSIKNFERLKSNVYNLGLSSANLSKYMLAKKIKQKLKYLKIKIIKNIKDPDQRDYYVSNKKIEKRGFKAKIKIESGIDELINVFNNTKENIINNY
ncbi:MAG: NAD-dependent epimerase/dehydratase [Pelagibacterales bacterium]|jgi:nucleoside-diphosphate-sugar epimerase|nr:NAD-dependent epimerase/dehydratase [Pelagibacterales bacterium]